MTYNEALKLKNEQTNFKLDGISYVYIVVPQLQEDIKNWRKVYSETSEFFTDETAKRFSSNNSYDFLYIIKK